MIRGAGNVFTDFFSGQITGDGSAVPSSPGFFAPGGTLVCSLPNFITGGTEACDLKAHAGDYPAPPAPLPPAPPTGWDAPGAVLDPATTVTASATTDRLRQFYGGVLDTINANQPAEPSSGSGNTLVWVLAAVAGALFLTTVVKR